MICQYQHFSPVCTTHIDKHINISPQVAPHTYKPYVTQRPLNHHSTLTPHFCIQSRRALLHIQPLTIQIKVQPLTNLRGLLVSRTLQQVWPLSGCSTAACKLLHNHTHTSQQCQTRYHQRYTYRGYININISPQVAPHAQTNPT